MQIHKINVNQDLAVEAYKNDREHSPVLIRIRSKSLADSEVPGPIVFWREEIEPLQDALEEAREVAERWANESH